jgi:pimeloyl-ACP methyl ester carboxylesterase
MTRTYDAHYPVARYDVGRRLPLIKSDTLAVSGGDDVFLNDLETIKKMMPRCRTKVIEGTGAYICLEKPEEFASAILEFLAGGQIAL